MVGEAIHDAIEAAEAELAELLARRTVVMEQLAALRRQRSADSRDKAGGDPGPSDWPAARKVELFRSLFRGRDDVFATRWEKPAKHRSGYAPRCANEWEPGICEKPRVRCGACAHSAFVSPGERETLAHLQGRQVMGIYPLLADDTCWLLAIDLDGDSWPGDIQALRQAAAE